MKKKKPKRRGRPSDYKKAYCAGIIEHMAIGGNLTTFAAKIDSCRDTMYEWIKAHPEFSYAIKRGRAKLEMYFMRLGRLGMNGQIPGFNAKVFIWMTRNCLNWSNNGRNRREF